jgi:hypothetical protein
MSANVTPIAIFLANMGISGLAYAVLTATQTGGIGNSRVGEALIAYMNQLGIRGRFRDTFGY